MRAINGTVCLGHSEPQWRPGAMPTEGGGLGRIPESQMTKNIANCPSLLKILKCLEWQTITLKC